MRTTLLAPQHQVRLVGIRFAAYEQQIAELRQQVAQVDDSKAEVNKLRKRLGHDSSNSSKPPSPDPPSYKATLTSETEESKKRAAQPGHQREGAHLEACNE